MVRAGQEGGSTREREGDRLWLWLATVGRTYLGHSGVDAVGAFGDRGHLVGSEVGLHSLWTHLAHHLVSHVHSQGSEVLEVEHPQGFWNAKHRVLGQIGGSGLLAMLGHVVARVVLEPQVLWRAL